VGVTPKRRGAGGLAGRRFEEMRQRGRGFLGESAAEALHAVGDRGAEHRLGDQHQGFAIVARKANQYLPTGRQGNGGEQPYPFHGNVACQGNASLAQATIFDHPDGNLCPHLHAAGPAQLLALGR